MYTAKETCKDGLHENCVTASGEPPIGGISSTCPRRFKFGTLFMYDGRLFVCLDRTAKRYDDRFDLYGMDHEAAIKFGIKKNQKITLLFQKP